MNSTDIEAARRRLLEALPATATWWINAASLTFDFAPLHRRLQSAVALIDEVDEGIELDVDPAELLLFGSQDYAGGARLAMVLFVGDSSVRELDLEQSQNQLRFLNSGLHQFIDTFAAMDAVLRHRGAESGSLPARLREIDPLGFARSQWRLLLEALK